MSDTMKIGRYTVEFDDRGRAQYRVESSTATNAVDFLKHHRALCFAMMNAHPEELAAYRIEADRVKRVGSNDDATTPPNWRSY